MNRILNNIVKFNRINWLSEKVFYSRNVNFWICVMALFDETSELLTRLSMEEVARLWIRCKANDRNDFDVSCIFYV